MIVPLFGFQRWLALAMLEYQDNLHIKNAGTIFHTISGDRDVICIYIYIYVQIYIYIEMQVPIMGG